MLYLNPVSEIYDFRRLLNKIQLFKQKTPWSVGVKVMFAVLD